MEFKQTKQQVARGTRADAETHDKFFLIKRTFELRPTYQIRLLTYRAQHEGRKLVIEIPVDCRVHHCLQDFALQHRKHVQIVRK